MQDLRDGSTGNQRSAEKRYPKYTSEYFKRMEIALESRHDTRAKFSYVMKTIIPLKGERVLDLGCGTGHYLMELERAGCEGVGVDFSLEALKIARQLKKLKKGSFSLIRGDVEKLPFLSEYFDKVLLVDTIEHLKNPISSLREIRRTLKVGGKLIITTMPNNMEVIYLLIELLKKLKTIKRNFLDEIYHLSLYNPLTLARDLKTVGFLIEKIFTYRILGPVFDLMRAKRNDYLDNHILCNAKIGYILGHGILVKCTKTFFFYDRF